MCAFGKSFEHTYEFLSFVPAYNSVFKVLQVGYAGREISKVAILILELIGVVIEHLVDGKLQHESQWLFTPCSFRVEFTRNFTKFILELIETRPSQSVFKGHQLLLNAMDRVVEVGFDFFLRCRAVSLLVAR